MFVFLRKGPLRESNSRPLAPKARIIPLDQAALLVSFKRRSTTELQQHFVVCRYYSQCVAAGGARTHDHRLMMLLKILLLETIAANQD
jgi:hypothetical protein